MLKGIILKTLIGFLAAASAGIGSPAPTATAGDSQVKISWAPPPEPIFGVQVEESLDSGTTWVSAAKLPPTSTHVNIQNLVNGKNYWFRVRWIWLDTSLGIPSPTLVEIPIKVPNAPTSLIATPSADQVGLSWDKDSNKSIVGYEVDQSLDNGNTWTVIKANTGSPSNGYLVNNLTAGKTYTFRIRAIGFSGVQSEYSEVATAKVIPAPTGGYALKYTIDKSKVTLTWDTPADLSDVQNYQVNVSSDGGINWYKVATTPGGVNTALVPYVIGGSTYQVIATSSEGLTSDSQIQLVENNIIPDAVPSTNFSGTPDSLVPGASTPSPSPSSTINAPSAASSKSPFPIIIIVLVALALIGITSALVSSRKNKSSKNRYKAKKKPRKPNKKKDIKKKPKSR